MISCKYNAAYYYFINYSTLIYTLLQSHLSSVQARHVAELLNVADGLS